MDGIKILLTQVASTFSLAVEIRKKINGYLQTVIAANDKSLQKLVSLAEKKHLMAGKTDTGSIKKKLEEVLKEAQKAVDEAEKLWNQLTYDVIDFSYYDVNCSLACIY